MMVNIWYNMVKHMVNWTAFALATAESSTRQKHFTYQPSKCAFMM